MSDIQENQDYSLATIDPVVGLAIGGTMAIVDSLSKMVASDNDRQNHQTDVQIQYINSARDVELAKINRERDLLAERHEYLLAKRELELQAARDRRDYELEKKRIINEYKIRIAQVNADMEKTKTLERMFNNFVDAATQSHKESMNTYNNMIQVTFEFYKFQEENVDRDIARLQDKLDPDTNSAKVYAKATESLDKLRRDREDIRNKFNQVMIEVARNIPNVKIPLLNMNESGYMNKLITSSF